MPSTPHPPPSSTIGCCTHADAPFRRFSNSTSATVRKAKIARAEKCQDARPPHCMSKLERAVRISGCAPSQTGGKMRCPTFHAQGRSTALFGFSPLAVTSFPRPHPGPCRGAAASDSRAKRGAAIYTRSENSLDGRTGYFWPSSDSERRSATLMLFSSPRVCVSSSSGAVAFGVRLYLHMAALCTQGAGPTANDIKRKCRRQKVLSPTRLDVESNAPKNIRPT
ncbi:hypothetical protein C2E23DRAFT_140927 [Lenzites betulinus]|nr:hypothetical protein C2E23DRAFT_140927 [Lenzites betulinus]